jgi:uncharacterized protein YjbI with pentapeptide repeats
LPRIPHSLWGRIIRLAILALFAVAGLLALGATSALLLFVVPKILIEGQGLAIKDQLDAENAIRTTLLSGVGAIFVAGGLVFTARTFVATREGQITDRYSAAIDHLSGDKASAVIGGIYALERIGRDSPRDIQTITDVLCALIRETPYVGPQPSAAVTTALEVLSRIPGSDDVRRLDLRGVTMTGLRSPGLRLAGADLTKASFSQASIDRADLRACELEDADLTRATLAGSRLAKVHGGMRTLFVGAYLNGADLSAVKLPGARFDAASMIGVNASDASLRGADLSSAQFYDVSGKARANFSQADLTSAILDKANVQGVDFRSTKGLTKSQAQAALSNDKTQWPRDLV